MENKLREFENEHIVILNKLKNLKTLDFTKSMFIQEFKEINEFLNLHLITEWAFIAPLLKKISASNPITNIIFLTSHNELEQFSNMMNSFFKDYIIGSVNNPIEGIEKIYTSFSLKCYREEKILFKELLKK